MENLIKASNRRKRRPKNSNKLRSKLNLAYNIVNNSNKLCIEYPLSHKNAVLSKTVSRFSTATQSKTNVKDSNNCVIKQQFKNAHIFNNIIWNIPYSNGKGNLDTVVTIQPLKYPNKFEICKALMSIITSYINESVPDYFNDYGPKKINRSQIIRSNCKYLHEIKSDKNREFILVNKCEQQTGLNTKNLLPSITEEDSSSTEEESPYHRYYPHRLNQ